MVISLQLGVEHVSRAAQKEDRGMTVRRRHQLKVLAGDDNIRGDRKKKICRFLTLKCTQIGQKVRNVRIQILLRKKSCKYYYYYY
jgi:hypothetical protein